MGPTTIPLSESDRLAWRVAVDLMSREATGAAWRLTLDSAGEGRCRVSMTPTKDMLDASGAAHSGIIFALAISALTYACNSRNVAAALEQCSITFLGNGLVGERISAEAREVSHDGLCGVYTVTVLGDDERTIAALQGVSRSLGRAVLEVTWGRR